MHVELAADLFGDTDDTDLINSMNDLFRCFVSGQHDLVIDDDTVPAATRFLAGHLPKQAKAYAAITRGTPNRAAWTGTSQRSNPRRVCRADAIHCAADLCRAAKLVLENGQSDKCFVVAIAHVFGGRRIVEALDRGWLEIEHAGGAGEMRKVALEQACRYRRLCRVAVLYDSDRWMPNTKSKYEDHAEELRGIDITVHILLLREAENYVPYGILECLGPSHQRRAQWLRTLDETQRGHFDMKHGFKKKAPSDTEVRADQAELFRGIAPETRAGLHDGFGEDLLDHLYRHREALSEQDFDHLGPDAVADLRMMLDAIASQI